MCSGKREVELLQLGHIVLSHLPGLMGTSQAHSS